MKICPNCRLSRDQGKFVVLNTLWAEGGGTKMMKLKLGQPVTISNLALAYSDYKNVQGTLFSIEGDSAKVVLPLKALCEEDERELHKEGDLVFVKVATSLLV